MEVPKSCSLIFSSTRSRQGFCGNQLLHQILVNFGFQGVFWNRLDEQNLKLTLGSQLDQDLAEKKLLLQTDRVLLYDGQNNKT